MMDKFHLAFSAKIWGRPFNTKLSEAGRANLKVLKDSAARIQVSYQPHPQTLTSLSPLSHSPRRVPAAMEFRAAVFWGGEKTTSF